MPTDPKYISYLRVSTAKQGASGLGLEAQRETVARFVGADNSIQAEFIEIESGKKNARTQLAAAINEAQKIGAKLVIAKLDRLSRNAGFIFQLRDSGIDFICADMPDANTLTIGIFAALAQHERELISSRTKSALSAKKAQGAILGKPENLTEKARLKGLEIRKSNAKTNENNRRAAALAVSLREAGLNWSQIANKLNVAGFKTARDKQFQAVQVQRLVAKN